MPNTKTAKKQLKVTKRNQAVNFRNRTILKNAIKAVRAAIESGTDEAQAKSALDNAKKVLHRSATRRIIKRQNANRRISRLSKAFNRVFTPADTASAGEG